jgi:hypothetical protein
VCDDQKAKAAAETQKQEPIFFRGVVGIVNKASPVVGKDRRGIFAGSVLPCAGPIRCADRSYVHCTYDVPRPQAVRDGRRAVRSNACVNRPAAIGLLTWKEAASRRAG